MADPLATALNNANPLQPGNPDLQRVLTQPQFDWNKGTMFGGLADALSMFGSRAKDYLANTSWDDVREAVTRANPLTAEWKFLQDLEQHGADTAVENARVVGGTAAQMPTDVIAGTAALPKFVSTVTGVPIPGSDALIENVSKPVRQFGADVGSALAGQPVTDELLRGTPAQMGGNMLRTLASAITPAPVPPVVRNINLGSDFANTMARVTGRALEVMSPLAVNPTGKSFAINAAVGTTLPVALEALKNPDDQASATPQTPEQQAANTAIDKSDAAVKQSSTHVVQAGGITGNPWIDTITGLVIGGYAWHYGMKTDIGKKIAQGVDKATGYIPSRIATGYNPALEAEKTFQPTSTLVRQQYQDETASIFKSTEDILKAGNTMTPAQVDAYALAKKEEGAMRRGASIGTRLQTFNRDGTFLDTPISTTPMNDYIVNARAAGPAIQETASKVLHAQNEMNVRQNAIASQMRGIPIGTPAAPVGSANANIMAQRVLSPGSPLAGRDSMFSHNLSNYTYSDLNNIVTQGMADPQVANIVNQTRDMINKSWQYMDVEHMYTPQQLTDFKRKYPHYMPTAMQEGEDLLMPRNVRGFNMPGPTGATTPRGSADFAELGNALDTIPKYMERVFRQAEGNKIKRDYLQMAERERLNGNVVAEMHVGDTIKPGSNRPKFGPDVAHKVVEWRDVNGNLNQTVVHDAAVRDALNNVNNPTALQMAGGLLDWGRFNSRNILSRTAESAMVGPLSMIRGSFFPLTGLGYNYTLGTATPKYGRVTIGPLSTALRIPGALGENMLGVLADRASLTLHNSVLTNGFLANRILSPTVAQATADSLRNWYKTTANAAMSEKGLMGPNVGSAVDPSKIYSPTASVFEQPKWWQSGGQTGKFIGDMYHSVTNALPTAIWKQNIAKGVPPEEIAGAIRNMAGNPGVSGAFRGQKGTAKLLNEMPFGNITLQTLFKVAEVMSHPKNLGRFATATALTVGIPSALVTMWNAAQGPEYVKHQFFGRSPDQVGSNMYIAMPGKPPTEGLEVSYMDPITRAVHIASQALVGAHLGLFDGSYFRHLGMDDGYSAARANEISSRFINDMPGTYVAQAIAPPVPPVFGAPLAAMGMKIPQFGQMRVADVNRRAGYVTPSTAPDPMSEQMLQTHMPMHMEEVLRSIGGSTADFVYKLLNGISTDIDPTNYQRNNRTYDLGGALSRAKDEVGQTFADNFPGAGQVFGTFRNISPSFTATAQYVKSKFDPLKEVTDAYSATHAAGGRPEVDIGTKKTGQLPYAGATPTMMPGTVEDQMASRLVTFRKGMATTEGQITQAYREQASIRQDNTLTPYERRARLEQWTYHLTDLQERLSQDISRIEATMSGWYGVDFKMDKLDPGKPMLGMKPRMP